MTALLSCRTDVAMHPFFPAPQLRLRLLLSVIQARDSAVELATRVKPGLS